MWGHSGGEVNDRERKTAEGTMETKGGKSAWNRNFPHGAIIVKFGEEATFDGDTNPGTRRGFPGRPPSSESWRFPPRGVAAGGTVGFSPTSDVMNSHEAMDMSNLVRVTLTVTREESLSIPSSETGVPRERAGTSQRFLALLTKLSEEEAVGSKDLLGRERTRCGVKEMA